MAFELGYSCSLFTSLPVFGRCPLRSGSPIGGRYCLRLFDLALVVMDILKLLARELGCNLSLTQAGGDRAGGQVTARAGRFAQTLVRGSLATAWP